MRSSLRSYCFLLVLCGLSFFAGLGWQPIGDSDEAFYAEAAREMLELDDWLTPHYNYEYRFQKPILFYWLIAVTYRVAGATAWAARFWSAMAGLAITVLVYRAGRRWYDERTGLIAGAITATNFGYFALARLSLPDLPLAFFMTAAIWLGLQYFQNPTRSSFMGSAVAASLGVLTKGPVGFAVPALVLLAAYVASFRRRRLTPRDVAIWTAVVLVISSPWYVVMFARHGWEYLHGFFVGDNFERFVTSRFNEPRPLWYYLPIVFGGMLPWSPFLMLLGRPAAIVVKWHAWSVTGRSLLVWAGMPLLFFTLSVGKQPRYILVMLPPLAIAAGHAIRRATDVKQPGPLFSVTVWLAGSTFVALSGLLWRARPLLEPLNTLPLALVASSVGMMGLLVVWWVHSRWWRQTPLVLASTAAVALPLAQLGTLAPIGRAPVEAIAEQISSARGEASRCSMVPQSGMYNVFVRNLVFYTRTKQIELASDKEVASFLSASHPVVCVLTEKDLRRIEQGAGIRAIRLGEAAYFNAAGLKLGTLLAPDPGRDIERAVIVTNQTTALNRRATGDSVETERQP